MVGSGCSQRDVDLVISVCSPADIDVWKVVSRVLPDRVPALRHIVIVPDESLVLFQNATDERIQVQGENSYTHRFLPDLEESLRAAENMGRRGWYLQQFVKLEAIRRLESGQRAIIWDADTVPLRVVSLFDADEAPIFYPSSEYHLPYFATINRALGLDRLVSFSFIAQCLAVNEEWSAPLFQELGGDSWHVRLLAAADLRESSAISEYELLGTWFSHHGNEPVHWKKSSWLRSGRGWLGPPNRRNLFFARSAGFDYAAFEQWETDRGRHKELVRRVRRRTWGRLKSRMNRRRPSTPADSSPSGV